MMRCIRVLGFWMVCMTIGWTGLAGDDVGKAAGKTAEPKWEAYAFTCTLDYLDGPRLEALGTDKGRKATNDTEGNWFILNKCSTPSMRCIRLNGQIETITGDDRWSPNLNISEGPAAYFPNMSEGLIAGDQSNLIIGIVAYGLPLKGEDFGCVYVYNMQKVPYKVFKNKDKEDRWWFKRLGNAGETKPPTTLGQSAQIAETNMANVRIGQGWMTWEGHLYKFDSDKDTITCILTPADYLARAKAAVTAFGKTKGGVGRMTEADRIILADDGTMYVMHPWREGNIFKISADRTKFEYIIQNNRDVKGWNIDGPGLYTTWHCGPSWIKTSGDTLFLRAIDSPSTRRWRDGRISVLCMDGEWREHSIEIDRKAVRSPSGMGYRVADHGLPYINVHYTGHDHRMFRFGPVDFTKPTVGPLVKAKGE